MRTLSITLLVSAALLALFQVSCESNTYDEIAGVVENPTYEANVKGIMEQKCIGCHNPDYGAEPNLRTYEEVKAACENNELLCRISGTSCGSIMPKEGKMPKARIDIIANWIEQGYVEQ